MSNEQRMCKDSLQVPPSSKVRRYEAVNMTRAEAERAADALGGGAVMWADGHAYPCGEVVIRPMPAASLASNLDLAQELVALIDTIDDKGISDTWPELPWNRISAAYEKLWEQKREIERLRANIAEMEAADTSHLPYEKGWQDGRADAWAAYNAGSQVETSARRDTGIDDAYGQRLFEGDRVHVEWTAELGITEIDCIAEGTVVYMPDKITAAWFVQFDRPYTCGVCEDGRYECESQMLVQAREIGDECLIQFKRIGPSPEKTPEKLQIAGFQLRCENCPAEVVMPTDNRGHLVYDITPATDWQIYPKRLCPACQGAENGGAE